MDRATDRVAGVGDRLRRDRLAAGYSQEELAEKAGISIRAISDLESGRTRRPHKDTLSRLADALKLPAADPYPANEARRWPSPAQLPADLADFTGRVEQTGQLAALLTGEDGGRLPGAVPIAAICGAGGTGKTALAVHIGHQVASCFPDGQIFLNVRGSSPQPVPRSDALARILRDLGADPEDVPADEDERAGRFRSMVAGRRLLIILDDVRDAAQVRLLLPGAPGCAAIVTGRNSLPDLESGHLLRLEALDGASAAALFTRIVGPARAAGEPDAVRDVVAACGGLPLAIRIAAARLAARSSWSVGALADRLADARSRLDELHAGDLGVRASFAVSYANARRRPEAGDDAPDWVFRMLGLIESADFCLPAAAALLRTPTSRGEKVLEYLVDAHLLQSPRPGRYRFHDLLRVYAAERVREEELPAERSAAVRRLLEWYLQTAISAARLISPHRTHVTHHGAEPGADPVHFGTYAEAVAWLDAEYANLVAAAGQASDHGLHDIAWKLPIALWDQFLMRGHLDDWMATHEAGLASARILADRHAEQWLLGHLGVAYITAGRPLDGIECMRQRLVIQRAAGDVRLLVGTLQNLGIALIEAGRPDEAVESMQEALMLSRQIGDRNGEARAMTNIGGILHQQGELQPAIAAYQEALDAFKETNDRTDACMALAMMSTVRRELGHLDAARTDATAALELSREIGHRTGEAEAMSMLGKVDRDQGFTERARAHWLGAHRIFTDLGNPAAKDVAADLAGLG